MSRVVKEIKEIHPEDLKRLAEQILSQRAMLETISLALYHLQDEPEPVSKAVTISFAVQHVAEELEGFEDITREMYDTICVPVGGKPWRKRKTKLFRKQQRPRRNPTRADLYSISTVGKWRELWRRSIVNYFEIFVTI